MSVAGAVEWHTSPLRVMRRSVLSPHILGNGALQTVMDAPPRSRRHRPTGRDTSWVCFVCCSSMSCPVQVRAQTGRTLLAVDTTSGSLAAGRADGADGRQLSLRVGYQAP